VWNGCQTEVTITSAFGGRCLGAGANTLADAVACGTPTVTFRGRFHRGWWAAALLDTAGLCRLVAEASEEYVAAVRTANDEAERCACSARLREFGARWLDQPRPAEELEAIWVGTRRGVPVSRWVRASSRR
jgi:predicted O-linked N-acetylglucosamine transferase (SPINDLY family)